MPNFFIIGAPKAGTTSLYNSLRQHPEVYMSPVKEPGYFLPESGRGPVDPRPWEMFARTRQEYLALFEGVRDETAIGEATPSYLHGDCAAAGIRKVVPDAKLIAVLRNPLERAFSGYSMRVTQDAEKLTFAEVVAAELDGVPTNDGWNRTYLRPGFYGRYLSRYLELFDADQLRVYLYEDLSRRPDDLWRDLCTFLEVEPSFVPEIAHDNVTLYQVKRPMVDRFFRFGPAKRVAQRLASDRSWAQLKKRLERWNSVVPEFPPEVRRRLVELYRDDIARTGRLIDRDLSAWLD